MRKAIVASLAALAIAGCGTSTPSDVALLTQACREARTLPGYDKDYAAIDRYGSVVGIAACTSDGAVANWNPRPSGSGDRVELVSEE